MRKYRIHMIAGALFLCIVLVVWILYINRSWTEKEAESAKVNVVQFACFSLLADGNEVAYFSRLSPVDSLMEGMTTSLDSALVRSENVGVWVNSSSMFPSAFGLVMTVDENPQMEAQRDRVNEMMKDFIARNREWMIVEQRRMANMADEVDYYLKHHTLEDNEYMGVASYSNQLASAQEHGTRMMELLDSVIQHARKIEVGVVRMYEMDSLQMSPVNNILRRPSLWHMHSETDEDARFVVLENDELTDIPDSCVALSTPLFLDTDFSDLIAEWKVKFLHLNDSRPLKGSALMELSLLKPVPSDSLSLYEGSSCDTLRNRYCGVMTEKGVPHGYGVMHYGNGDYYEGEWENGLRHGRGFHVTKNKIVLAGEWGDGNYLGEKMCYTDNRVYGIDISRYQHEKGGQIHPINWNAMRITSLGFRHNAQVEGKANFPVSFVFIKSTQGVTIKSAYYEQDSRAARAHGILCGAYHFFSLKAGGKEQATYFLENTEMMAGDLPPVLDVEPTKEQLAQYGDVRKVLDEVRMWLQMVEKATGRRPILYTNQSFVQEHLVHAPDLCRNYTMWVARYNMYRPEVRQDFWQMCDNGRVVGIHGNVDINVFNGFRDQFDAQVPF